MLKLFDEGYNGTPAQDEVTHVGRRHDRQTVATPPAPMQSSKSLIILAGVASCLIVGTDGFVGLNSLSLPGVLVSSRTHVSSTPAQSRRYFPTHGSRPHEALMASGSKKRRRRKEGTRSGTPSSPVSTSKKPQAPSTDGDSRIPEDTVVEGAGQLGDVLEGDRGIEALFSEDWSDMPANDGMVKSNVSLAGRP